MAEQVGQQLQIQGRAQHHQRPGAQCGHPGLHHREQQESEAQHRDQVAVLRNDRLIDHPLHEERREDGKDLQHQRQHQDLRQRGCEARQAADQRAQADALALGARRELRGRR